MLWGQTPRLRSLSSVKPQLWERCLCSSLCAQYCHVRIGDAAGRAHPQHVKSNVLVLVAKVFVNTEDTIVDSVVHDTDCATSQNITWIHWSSLEDDILYIHECTMKTSERKIIMCESIIMCSLSEVFQFGIIVENQGKIFKHSYISSMPTAFIIWVNL